MAERLTPYLRYVALVGVGAVLLALGALLVVGQTVLWIEIVGGLGVLLLAIAALAQPAQCKAWLTGRQARYGGNAALMSLAFVVILGLVNYLGTRYHLRWDVTENKAFSLSPQTLDILASLQEPVTVKLFFTPGHYNRQQAQDLIQEYAIRSDKLSYEFIDPDVERRIAMEYKIARDGTIVFERGERREITFGVQEQDLTSALLKVTRDEKRGVFFLTGHQERDPQSSESSGYSLIRQVLENENYRVERVNLAATEAVPEGMNVLVIAAPRVALGSDEISRIRQWVEQGVSLLVMLEPGGEDPLGGLLQDYGLVVSDNIIIDPTRSFFGDIAAPLVDRYQFHQITKDMAGLTTFFPTARALTRASEPVQGWQIQDLASSSENSWAETDYRSQQVKKDENESQGPLALAVAIEPAQAQETEDSTSKPKGRLVVIGDANFIENGILQQVRGIGNVDLFMNAVGWLAEEESLISIRPKEPENRQVILTPPQARGIIYTNILFAPLLVLIAGAIVWWRRR